ncbi:MAG: hypothetical protein ABI668_00235 [Sphingorhabdus sp.]
MIHVKTGITVFAASAMLMFSNIAIACVVEPAFLQDAGESDEAFEVRHKQREIELNKTPEQRELELQAWHWDNSDMVFIGRYEKIKVDGKIYPRSKKLNSVRGKTKVPQPEPIEPPIFIPFFGGGEAYITPFQTLKGSEAFQPSWHYVGGITTCGTRMDGSLGLTWVDEDVIVFARWADRYRWVKGKEVKSKYLDLFGIAPKDVTEPRLAAALSDIGNNAAKE